MKGVETTPERDALMLKGVELHKQGYSYPKIGKMLGINGVSVRYWVQRNDFNKIKYIKLNVKAIQRKDYKSLSVDELRIYLWALRSLREKCERYLIEHTNERPIY
jgi:hypothetical protein